jgi:hypothetical protein
VSISSQQGSADAAPAGEESSDSADGGPVEAFDVLPVLAEEARVVDAPFSGQLSHGRDSGTMIPAVQAAAVAAGGFVAGAAVVGLVARRRRPAALSKGRQTSRLTRGRRRRASSPAAELVQIVGSRSLLVDVHLLGGRD